MQVRVNTDLVSGLFGLVLAGLFWSQRGNIGFMSSVFPDTVLVILALISAVLVLRGTFVSEAEVFELDGTFRVLAVIGMLVLWWLGITYVGFVTTSVPIFVALALFLLSATRPFRWSDLLISTAVAVVLTYGFFVVFTEILGIRPFRAPFM